MSDIGDHDLTVDDERDMKRAAIADVVHRQSTNCDYHSSDYGYTYIRPQDIAEFIDDLCKAAGLDD